MWNLCGNYCRGRTDKARSCPECTYKISVGERMWKNLYGRRCYSCGRQGIPTTVMSIPLRYMHNPAEVCSMEDVQGCIDVLAEFLCGIGSDICLKPLKG